MLIHGNILMLAELHVGLSPGTAIGVVFGLSVGDELEETVDVIDMSLLPFANSTLSSSRLDGKTISSLGATSIRVIGK